MARNRHPKPRPPEKLLQMWKRLNPNKDIYEFDCLVASIQVGECLAVKSGNLVIESAYHVWHHKQDYQGIYLLRLTEKGGDRV